MQVHLLGTRGSIPSGGEEFTRYGGNTSCVAVSHDGAAPTLILDAGSGLAAADWLIGDAPFVGSILLTHLHWDHVIGLPFFREGDRAGSSVRLFAPEQDGEEIDEVFERFFAPPLFPVSLAGLRGNWTTEGLAEGQHELEGFTVLAREIPHKGGRTLGFRISDGVSSVAYMPDHSPTSLGLGPNGDGAHHEAALALADGVDLLIHDSQFTNEEFDSRWDWGHCVYDYPIGLADAAGVGRTILFHHDPFRTDREVDAIAATIDRSDVGFAKEGSTISLGSSLGSEER